MTEKKDPEESKNDEKIVNEMSFWERITNFSDWDRKTWAYVAIFVAILGFTAYLFYRMFQDETYLFGLIIDWVVRPIAETQSIGWIIFIVFMGVQGIFAPIPSEVVLISAGMIWPSYLGFILGVVGSMVAGWLCYFLSRKGGRPIVEKAVGKENIETLDVYIQKYGAPVIFLARAFPFLAFDPISYVSGLVKIDTKKYLIATFLGSLVRVAFYTWLGANLVGQESVTDLTNQEIEGLVNQHSSTFNQLLFLIIGIMAVAFLLYQYVLMPYLHKKSKDVVADKVETVEEKHSEELKTIENDLEDEEDPAPN